jgi:hypothetical protein
MARLGLPNPSHILPDLAIRQEQRGKLFNPRYYEELGESLAQRRSSWES